MSLEQVSFCEFELIIDIGEQAEKIKILKTTKVFMSFIAVEFLLLAKIIILE